MATATVKGKGIRLGVSKQTTTFLRSMQIKETLSSNVSLSQGSRGSTNSQCSLSTPSY